METTNNKNREQLHAKFSLVKTGASFALKKNGEFCQCPFRTPQIVPGKIHGSAEMQIPICSNACQFFNIYEYQDFNRVLGVQSFTEVFLSCSQGNSFNVTNE